MLTSKDKFFNVFKLWLIRAKVSGKKLDYLRIDGRREFISAAF